MQFSTEKNKYYILAINSLYVYYVQFVFTLLPILISTFNHSRKIVWISGIGFNTSIEISNMDGTDRQTLLAGSQHEDPRSLDYDPRSNRY